MRGELVLHTNESWKAGNNQWERPKLFMGAPEHGKVSLSIDYLEFMLESGVIDAAGRSTDGMYWRTKSVFGPAAEYFNQPREIAEQLDCVMDGVSIKLGPMALRGSPD